jgi:hypothetical protein
MTGARAAWKAYWHQLRIIRREAFKAQRDAMIFGIGCVRIKDGFINHVLPQAIFIGSDGEVSDER